MLTAVPKDTDSISTGAALRPEILAPAGNEAMLHAAVENGADAVYFGVEAFNARLRADNFRREDLPEIMRRLHDRGVKGYLTLNILIFNNELEEAVELLRIASRSGVDAVLVQDLGLAFLANELVPDLPIHASTQMTLTCAESVLGAERLGLRLERIVTARELSIRELRRFRKEVDREIEVFVHGALCVAYSGQCLTSEALGGRSANRGECAQACRLPYDLIVDGERENSDDLRYLLSPKDLAAYADVRELMRIGIVSLKIEGRLKTPEYVAATVQAYRAAVDSSLQDRDSESPVTIAPPLVDKLETTFSRGFTKGYIHEINHQEVVEGRFSTKRGQLLGSVVENVADGIVAELSRSLRPGDGVVFDTGQQEDELGGRVYEIFDGKRRLDEFVARADGKPKELLVRFEKGRFPRGRIPAGAKIWKTSDPRIEAELRTSFSGDGIHFRRPISAHVCARVGEPLFIRLTDESGASVEVTDDTPLERATKHPLTERVLEEQLGRLGDTPFRLERLEAEIVDAPMCPLSRLNTLRREAVAALREHRALRSDGRREEAHSLPAFRSAHAPEPRIALPDGFSVLCRSLDQVRGALDSGIKTIYTEFEDIRLHKQAREIIPRDRRFVPATLRIIKPGEAATVRRLLQSEPDGILARNLASVQVLAEESPDLPLIGDFSLNVANDVTARLLIERGLSLLTPSYDLSYDQLRTLLEAAPPDWFELTLHQYMPMFHMEHCVFCRFLSSGTDSSNCGRPCEKHSVKLRDRLGYDHVLKADFSCRNTLFNAVAQSGAEYLPGLRELGVKRYRLDLLSESYEDTRTIVGLYSKVLDGSLEPSRLWQTLRTNSKLGVTRGALDHYDNGGIDSLYTIGKSRRPAHARERG